jgi:xanthine dehydrogenase YagR molybdenum-binding subunit
MRLSRPVASTKAATSRIAPRARSTAGLEDYRIPGIGDIPDIEIEFIEDGFEHVRGGSVGLGEVSTIAVAASLGNAVYNATGWRPRDLPIRPDRLLAGVAL